MRAKSFKKVLPVMIFILIFPVPTIPMKNISITQAEKFATKFLLGYEVRLVNYCHQRARADWLYATNLTDENEAINYNVTLRYAAFSKKFWKRLRRYPWQKFNNHTLARMFELKSTLGANILPVHQLKSFIRNLYTMKKAYNGAKLCHYKRRTECNLTMESHVTKAMALSRDNEELKYYWEQWRAETGEKFRKNFPRYVQLANAAARMNGHKDMGQLWRASYEWDFLKEDVHALWGQVRPLYEELHAYARHKLHEFYGSDIIEDDGLIPAHLLGNMWGQIWTGIESLLNPTSKKRSVGSRVSREMRRQNYTVNRIFEEANAFFESLGLIPVKESFWENSILLKPRDRNIICHPSAWDFCDGQDFRIKQCTGVNSRDYVTAHHELGHIQYYMQYKDQPLIFREGANPGFHEAVGDALALSVQSPKHLQRMGLLTDHKETRENTISFLLHSALKTVTSMPWELLVDQWRWDVFSGKVQPSQYNCHWWKLRHHFQGMKAPSQRNASHFDPGSKFHVANGFQYISYFVAHILQFQIYEALCKTAGEYEENGDKLLYNCDLMGSKEAGRQLSTLLKLGRSRHWSKVLAQLTGSHKKMDATPLLHYYQPLYQWLREENAKANVTIGWRQQGHNDNCNSGLNDYLVNVGPNDYANYVRLY